MDWRTKVSHPKDCDMRCIHALRLRTRSYNLECRRYMHAALYLSNVIRFKEGNKSSVRPHTCDAGEMVQFRIRRSETVAWLGTTAAWAGVAAFHQFMRFKATCLWKTHPTWKKSDMYILAFWPEIQLLRTIALAECL